MLQLIARSLSNQVSKTEPTQEPRVLSVFFQTCNFRNTWK